MWRLDRGACAILALIALASVAAIASVGARDVSPRQRQEHWRGGGERQTARREVGAQPGRRARQVHAAGVRAAARREAYYAHYARERPAYARERPDVNYHRPMAERSFNERRLAAGRVMRETRLAGGGRVREVSRRFGGAQVRVVRYGNIVSGTVERTIRPGLVSRTFVSGGHVLYAHVYQRHVWRQFGTAFAYETFVPAVRYPAGYYAWALAAWPRPVTFAWGWQVQPWYPRYGVLFTPYPVYTSPDLWMTDYILAQSLQTAYQAQTAAPPPEPSPTEAPAAPAADSSAAAPGAEPGDTAPAPQPDDTTATLGDTTGAAPSGDVTPAPQPNEAPAAPQSDNTPSAPVAPPPAVTPQIKEQLDAQIKVQLKEQQAAQATPATLTTQSTPPALRPNHVFFQVVQPLEVPAGAADRSCSLSPDDYIRRTGTMDQDDWKIPVVVELSRPSDCPAGLKTHIGLNDLNAMENEQEAQVMEAMQAASSSMGPNGPPSGPGSHPTLIADGSAAPDPGALEAIRRAQ